MNDLTKEQPFSTLLLPSSPAIYPAHVWHTGATNLHTSIMMNAIVLKGRERKVVMFRDRTHGIRPQCCCCIKREGGDERCQCPLSNWCIFFLNNRKKQREEESETTELFSAVD